MRIDYVEIAGFRSFREKRRIDFGAGFTVITGRNGVGKSTIIDAIDFALTGSINKYRVQNAKGGGLSDHIWWVGEGVPPENFVALGVVDDDGKRFALKRFKDGRVQQDQPGFERLLIKNGDGQPISLRKLSDTTILRDELISELSLDLSEQARFTAVLEAIAPITGPDLASKVETVASLANNRTTENQRRLSDLQARLAQNLDNVAVARNSLALSPNLDSAVASLRSQFPDLPTDATARRQLVAQTVAELRLSASIVNDVRPRAVALSNELKAIDAEGVRDKIAALTVQLIAIGKDIERLRDELEERRKELRAAESENEQLAHLALLIDHGEAYGLDHGQCPLCAAARSEPEFLAAIEATKRRLADANNRVAEANAAVEDAAKRLQEAEEQQRVREQERVGFSSRIETAEGERQYLNGIFADERCTADPTDLGAIDRWLADVQRRQARLQDALVILESADTNDRIGTLEKSTASLRNQIDLLSGEVSASEVISSLARRVEKLTKAFPNEILAEQFDAVMPLLKEFYRRLRPHTDWEEIEYDFGGRIRATLNFYVADGKNPQFLFSSGQRRATGLAFLLAVHLARHWSNLRSLVLDDPVQHIDDYRALNLVEVLAAIRRTGHQIVVAVEDAALAGLLARRLRGSLEQHGCFYELGTAETGGTCVKQEYVLAPLPTIALSQSQAS